MKIKKILVSQPKPSSEKSPYYDIAAKFGVEVVFRPFIKVEGLTAREFRQSKINILDYTAIIFTSRTAINHFFNLCSELRITMPDTMKYFCVSETVALYLQKYIVYRKRKIFFGTSNKIEGLSATIEKHKKEKFLLPVSDVHQDNLAFLTEMGVNFTESVMYRTVSNDFSADEPFDYDVLLFFTPAGINSLHKNFPNFEQGDIKIGCMGTTTIQAMKDAGLRLDFTTSPEVPSISAALEKFLEKEQRRASREEAKSKK